METNVIYNEDCIGKNGMQRLPDNSIDMILADLPYGTTGCKWDSIIPLEPLWEQYKRVIKENGAIVLTASQPFTTKLVENHKSNLKHHWVWDKGRGTGFQIAKYRPMMQTEDILVFTQNGEKVNYYPNMEERKKPVKQSYCGTKSNSNPIQDRKKKGSYVSTHRYPTNILKFKRDKNKKHPTQKPVKLFEYLIKTYTNKGEIVLDNVIGSGTTAVACLKTNRQFIGFEKEEKYYNIALKRIGKLDKSYYDELPEEEKPKQMQMF